MMNHKLHIKYKIFAVAARVELMAVTGEDPKKVVESYPNPKNSPLGPQKVQNDPKIKSQH